MNILILSPFYPYPLTQGGKVRVFNIIKYLSKKHQVILACLSDSEIADYGPLNNYCEEIICIERGANLWKDFPAFFFGREPFNYIRYSSGRFRNALRGLMQRRFIDIVQVEFSMMWQYADIFNGVSVILDAHNIEFEIIRQIRGTYRSSLRKLLYVIEEKKLRNKEEQTWRECGLCFTVSDNEKEIIASHIENSNKVFTIPNGVDLERFEFFLKVDIGKQLLFIGGMDYQPNLDSASYFLKKIFPLIQSKIPDVKLDIVGRELWRIGNHSNINGVEFHENVPDVIPYFRKADVLVVPLRYGAGTRIKILEAMAAGVPVVTTSKGCEGIDAINEEHLLIADSHDSFAFAVQRLLSDAHLKRSLALNARRLVEEKYSWERLVGQIGKAYAIVESKPYS